MGGTASDRQRLLELLVGLDRKAEALDLLEELADREPQQWSLRLMLAELRRDLGDRRGAERELRQILHQRPTQIEALQLMSLVLLEQGRGSAAEALIKTLYSASLKPPVQAAAMAQGLLLAEVQQRRERPTAAETTYRQLQVAFPSDQRPSLGLALLRRQEGNLKGALEALDQARQQGGPDDANKATLDRLAASWRLKALRETLPKAGVSPPPGSPASSRPGDGSGLQAP
jgi:tetratricopeptide (TPR) repeat protein